MIKLKEGSLLGSIAAGTGSPGSSNTQLSGPAGSFIDVSSNIYITDSFNARVMLWYNNSNAGVRVAGTGVFGNTTSTFGGASGLVVDSLGNMYISDYLNDRVMNWAPNAANGTLVAGSDGDPLNQPYGLYLDESNSYLYVADSLNHRIQRYHLGVSMNGTTVAGGNGQGSGAHQLNTPLSVYISKKTGDIYIYIADSNNRRVQRWDPGVTSGVTIADVVGISSTSSTLLN